MSIFVRAKRVTDPLDDTAKQRLVGGGALLSYGSSGSEHSGDDLADLLDDFFLDSEFETDQPAARYESGSDRVDSVSDCTDHAEDILRSALLNKSDSYRNLLYGHVMTAMEVFPSARNFERSLTRRKVMSFLRERGHNAAICKTKWDSSGNLTAGNYEFIDVLLPSSATSSQNHNRNNNNNQNRYIVDLDFAAQFEIARPTEQYLNITQCLPRLFVGKCEDLKRIVRVISDAAKRSLKCNDLTLPPWRKNCYMQNKWFGPYRRTVNASPVSSLITPVTGVKCRCVGFDDAVSRRLFVRTR